MGPMEAYHAMYSCLFLEDIAVIFISLRLGEKLPPQLHSITAELQGPANQRVFH